MKATVVQNAYVRMGNQLLLLSNLLEHRIVHFTFLSNLSDT